MFQPRIFPRLLALIILFLLLLACGITGLQPDGSQEPPAENVSEVDLVATGTKLAADFYATQTAAAPVESPTNTPEPSLTPTDTPSPAPTDTPEPTLTNTPFPTDTPLPSATPLPDVVVTSASVNIRTGPGTHYDSKGAMQQNETANVEGQAYDCAWLLITLPNGQTGWITGGSEYVTLNLSCSDIPAADIPPSPTPAAPPVPPTPDRPTVTVFVVNNTGGTLTIDLSGPAVYHFVIQTGRHPIQVVPGQYNYTGYGCGGASKSGVITMEEGDEWEWWCA